MEENKKFIHKITNIFISSIKNIFMLLKINKHETHKNLKEESLDKQLNMKKSNLTAFKKEECNLINKITYLNELNEALKSDLDKANERAHFFRIYSKNKIQEIERKHKIEVNFYKEFIENFDKKVKEFEYFLETNCKEKEVVHCFKRIFK